MSRAIGMEFEQVMGQSVLGAVSGAVERTRRLPDGDERVAQILRRDALNHHHGTATEGTWRLAGGSGGRIGAWFCAKQRAATLERSSTAAVGEQSEVADADQAFRQHVKQISAQELIGGNGHDLVLAAVGIVLPTERDAMVFEGHQALVGDGDAMGVAGQVVENMVGTTEGRLGIDDPVLVAEFPEEVAEGLRQGELLKRSMKLEPVVLEQLTELVTELLAEDLAECLDGQKESARRIDPTRTVRSKTASGNDVMDVGMMLEVLSPGMEHAEEPDLRAEVLGITSNFKQRRGTGAEEQVIEQPLVLEDERGDREGVERVRDGVHVPPGEVQIDSGVIERSMAEQHLDGAQVHPCFKHVSRVAVPPIYHAK
jgi:hypothetical protein